MKKLLSILLLFLCNCSSELEMKFYPDPILSKKCAEVEIGDQSAVALLEKMLVQMRHAPGKGIGLSAPQVGMLKRVIILDVPENPRDHQSPSNVYKMINPIIVWKSRELVPSPEGCTSISGSIGAVVMRHASVSVEYFDESFKKCCIKKATGLLAYCLQHEIDHLDGIMYINRLDPKKIYKVIFIDQIREEILKKGMENLSECVFIDKSNPEEYSNGVRTLQQIQKSGTLHLEMGNITQKG